ncbi:MAG: C40 family peptidase, partial [Kutzneria sp.]|nr:C40 family peptidase [Kutzneria sp.]
VAILIGVIALSAFGVVSFAGGIGIRTHGDTVVSAAPVKPTQAPAAGALRFERLANPARTVARDDAGAVAATMTDGARTVVITGPPRRLREPKFTAAWIDTSSWVRLAPRPWHAGDENADWFTKWFAEARGDQSPDVFAVAMQYADGAPPAKDANGVRFQGDAAFGPVAAAGAGRLEQSDFDDYLGIGWSFPDGPKRRANPAHYGATDCSGFVRLVYGYRLGYSLLGGSSPGPGLPRRAYAIAKSGPGVQLIADTHTRATDYDLLQPGDLVFFEVEGSTDQLDHVGIYLGVDNEGHHRFMSSRERANGPTFGDLGGASVLDDGGFYSKAWRTARRI